MNAMKCSVTSHIKTTINARNCLNITVSQYVHKKCGYSNRLNREKKKTSVRVKGLKDEKSGERGIEKKGENPFFVASTGSWFFPLGFFRRFFSYRFFMSRFFSMHRYGNFNAFVVFWGKEIIGLIFFLFSFISSSCYCFEIHNRFQRHTPCDTLM